MKAATLAALIAFCLYVLVGIVAVAVTHGLLTFLLGGLALWLAFRLGYALEDAIDG